MRLAAAGVFGLALAVRLAHLAALWRSPLGVTLVQDAAIYHAEALRIASGTPSPGASFFNVGYPYVLAAIHVVAGPSPAVAQAVQCVAGALTAMFLVLAGRRLGLSPAGAAIAGALYAIYLPAVFYDALLLTPSVVQLLLAVSLVALARWRARRGAASLAAAGLCLGLASVLRSNLLPLGPLAGIFVGLAAAGRRRGAVVAGFVALTLAPAAAVTIATGARSGEWVPVSANGGMNFWVGNHRGATGIYEVAPFLGNRGADAEAAAFRDEAIRRTGRAGMGYAAASAYWTRETLREIAAAPGAWSRGIVRKAVLFWTHDEPKTNVSVRFVSWFSAPLRALFLDFGWLALAAVAGWARGRLREDPAVLALLAPFLAVPWATCTLFFVSGEYRHPASLALALAAGAAGSPAARASRRLLAVAVPACVAIGAAAFLPRPDLDLAFDPYVDLRSHVRALAAARPDGNPPPEAFDRASRIVAAAPVRPDRDLFLLDTRSWLSWRRTAALADPESAREAFLDLRTIRRRAPAEIASRYGAPFAGYLLDAAAARVADLAVQPVVRDRPALAREAALLGGSGYQEALALARAGRRAEAEAFLAEARAANPHDGRVDAVAKAIAAETW